MSTSSPAYKILKNRILISRRMTFKTDREETRSNQQSWSMKLLNCQRNSDS